MSEPIAVITQFWDATDESFAFSRCYDEAWVEKLYRGFKRNLTIPFRFVCFSEKDRTYSEPIEQRRIIGKPGYGSCIQTFTLDCPSIIVGLDTVITGNCDALAEYALSNRTLALPRDPYAPERACNGVCLVPAGHRHIADLHEGQNDMDWIRQFPHEFIDDLFPKQVNSYKVHVKEQGLNDTRICYFHGLEKPHEIDEPWLADHWG
jgi:hypothetical protein